ncbi:nucleoside phosphorylase [Neobacillus sp. FSL H8-0543]|uniref:nucleoside phosphorylase n=1 Tax=Neobacillus sp. FSL H8-0543 TaxID=2954672 RepID=UPI0031596068
MTKQLPNLKVASDILPDRVLVCGDPSRAKMIADLLDNPVQLAQNREYHTYSGSWNGKQVAVVSHGVGAPGAAVCFEELIMGGVQFIIRVGTAGSYQKEIKPGSLVVSTAAVSCDGLTKQIVPHGFPAVADRKVVEALTNAAVLTEENIPVKEGITLTLDAFYSGVLEFPHQLYKKAGVVAVDMENSALFVIASIKGVQAGAILAIDGYADAELREEYNPHNDLVSHAVEAEMQIALDAITAL